MTDLAPSSPRVPTLTEEQRITQALPILDKVARRLAHDLGRRVRVDDLLSIGHLALAKLVRRYDPALSRFEPYLYTRLRWAMLDGVRRETHGRTVLARARALAGTTALCEAIAEVVSSSSPSPTSSSAAAGTRSAAMPPSENTHQAALRHILREHASALGIPLLAVAGQETAVVSSSVNPERLTLRRDAVDRLREVMVVLDDRERLLIERHYFDGAALAVIGRELGVSRASACRLHARALAKLAAAFT